MKTLDLTTLDSDPTSEVGQRSKEDMEEEKEEEIEQLKCREGFTIGETEDSKLLRKFLNNWEVHFNKPGREVIPMGKNKRK